jgi:retron-type reverse transcriptase
MNRCRTFSWKESRNNTRTVWVLKCDIRKFFASVDQGILLQILGTYISDPNILWLIQRIVESFSSTERGKGLPLGNLTSQLLVNIYMNEFDQFVKHVLKVKYYLRYADDFVILLHDRTSVLHLLRYIVRYLRTELLLQLHPDKVFIKTLASGVDFLGWVHFGDHRVLRTVTKKRMLKRVNEYNNESVLRSYLGLLAWGNAYVLKKRISC